MKKTEFRIPKRVVAAAIAATLGADDAKVASRLMLLTRMGFPAGANSGRGYRGGNTLDQFWQLILAFHMLEVGLPPSRTIEMINESWDIAYLAVSRSLPDRSDPDTSFFWVFAPAGLENFGPTRNSADEFWDRPVLTFAINGNHVPAEVPGLENVRTYTVINAGLVVRNALAALMNDEFGIDEGELIVALQEWANQPAMRLRQLTARK